MEGRRATGLLRCSSRAGIECRDLCGAGGGRDRWCVRLHHHALVKDKKGKEDPLSCPFTQRRSASASSSAIVDVPAKGGGRGQGFGAQEGRLEAQGRELCRADVLVLVGTSNR